jgi:hypothetical protein
MIRNLGNAVLIARPAAARAVRASSHHGAAARADEPLPLNHAGGDAIDIRNTVAAEPLGVALAGGPLLRGAPTAGMDDASATAHSAANPNTAAGIRARMVFLVGIAS